MVKQAATIQLGRLPVRDLRSSREGNSLTGEGARRIQVTDLHTEADTLAQQVLHLFGVHEPSAVGQRGQRLRQRAVMLTVQAAGQRQRADKPMSERRTRFVYLLPTG